MPDTDIESRLADARSQAATEATQLANERFLTALNDGNVKSNLSLATTLLANAEMSAEAVIQACAAAEDEKQAAIESAKSQAGTQQPDLKDLQESAHADEGNQDVSAEGEEQPKPSAKTTIGDRMAARKAKKGE